MIMKTRQLAVRYIPKSKYFLGFDGFDLESEIGVGISYEDKFVKYNFLPFLSVGILSYILGMGMTFVSYKMRNPKAFFSFTF